MPGPRLSCRTLALAALVALAACGSSGRELREPTPGQTAPPRKQDAAGTVSTTAPNQLSVFGLATTAWVPGGEIPERYSCDGVSISPPLAFFTPPPNATELALVVTDLDNGFFHWIVTGIPPLTSTIGEGELPAGATEATNSGGVRQWVGPCPPQGEQHQYEFALYALAAPPGVQPGQEPESAVAAIASAPLETATMTGTYERR
jgi:Raf kinase inhibitor-like YbhB/YbcL family protein